MDPPTLTQQIHMYKRQSGFRLNQLLDFLQVCDTDFMQKQYHIPSFSGVSKIQPPTSQCPLYIPFSSNLPHISSQIFDFENPVSILNDTQIHIPTCSKIIPENKPKREINVDINNFQDLVKVIRENEYDETYEYNIDLQSLHKIKDHLEELNSMVGLKKLKEELLNQLLYFSQNLHIGKRPDFMHTVLCGPPGTGKTEVAMILGKIYSKLGILKKNIFRKVTRNDLVAGYLGQTALKTKKVIDECLGGCLFIDEAYSLANDFEGDSYSRECIDVLCESLSAHKGDLMVIIAGYEDQLENTFFQANPGLKSRFIWKFHLQEYNAIELSHIFVKNIDDAGWTLGVTRPELEKWFDAKYKTFIHYGRDMELLFSYSKISHGRRIYGKSNQIAKQLLQSDIDTGYEKFKQNSVHKSQGPPMGMYS
jgi:SpoVK/Ycf46/Vps4 family AAA+-type ATPase